MGTTSPPRKEFPSVVDSAYEQYKQNLKLHKLVSEIMSPNIISITPEASMLDAAKLMGEKHVGSLIVKKYNSPVGIVTERDLLTTVLAQGKDLQQEKVESVMSYPLLTICLTAKIKEAAQAMIRKKGRLVVFDCNKLKGIVTSSDLVRAMPEVDETAASIDNFMTTQVVTVDGQTTVKDAARLMGQERIGSLIITSRGKPVGIFTERDLVSTVIAKDKPLELAVGAQASCPLITIPPGISVHQAAGLMAEKRIKRLPIMEQDTLLGIITARDLVEAYAR
jgi:CBS domain-containing protein